VRFAENLGGCEGRVAGNKTTAQVSPLRTRGVKPFFSCRPHLIAMFRFTPRLLQFTALAFVLSVPFFLLAQQNASMTSSLSSHAPAAVPPLPAGEEVITLGAGCFWCTESVFQQIPGVSSVISGYMGGKTKQPTYEQICGGDTGHAEVTRIVFDPKKLPLEKLLETFWKMHDPTQLNRQGNDVGTQYRSAIFYADEQQKAVAESSRKAAASHFRQPIVTEIAAAGDFYPAENYHQDYYRLNKNKNPYCRMVITPKLEKLGLEK
jgi:peptide-methionine (S)-S-oxide reductase